jgi:hypothetical protein
MFKVLEVGQSVHVQERTPAGGWTPIRSPMSHDEFRSWLLAEYMQSGSVEINWPLKPSDRLAEIREELKKMEEEDRSVE